MLPEWVQWTVAGSTVFLGVAVVVIAIQTFRIAARSEGFAARSKDLAEWQQYNEALKNFRELLEHRVGYAYQQLEVQDLDAFVHQFPRSPGEPEAQRAARHRQRELTGAAGNDKDYESLMFTLQPDNSWKLEINWSSYPRIEDAFVHTASQYLLPVQRAAVPSNATLVWGFGSGHLLVTRRAGAGVPA